MIIELNNNIDIFRHYLLTINFSVYKAWAMLEKIRGNLEIVGRILILKRRKFYGSSSGEGN